jgi:hypothetical protein
MAVSVLVALPVLFPLYEIVVLNLGLAALRRMEARANAALAAELEG